MSVEEIVKQYPSLKPADVHDALAYAYDHLDEIEADVAADDEATAKGREAGGLPTSKPAFCTDDDVYAAIAIGLRKAGLDADSTPMRAGVVRPTHSHSLGP